MPLLRGNKQLLQTWPGVNQDVATARHSGERKPPSERWPGAFLQGCDEDRGRLGDNGRSKMAFPTPWGPVQEHHRSPTPREAGRGAAVEIPTRGYDLGRGHRAGGRADGLADSATGRTHEGSATHAAGAPSWALVRFGVQLA